jgi:hypothetical protein
MSSGLEVTWISWTSIPRELFWLFLLNGHLFEFVRRTLTGRVPLRGDPFSIRGSQFVLRVRTISSLLYSYSSHVYDMTRMDFYGLYM